MLYDDEYFWNDDYSEYEEFMDNLKETLRGQIKDEVTMKIKRLEEEVRELKAFRDQKDKYDNELAAMKRELDKTKAEVECKAKQLRLKDFMQILDKPAWGIESKYEYVLPKCDKCDDDRMIHFFSPSGKEHKEECSCRKHKYMLHPVEAVLVGIRNRAWEYYEKDKAEEQGVELEYLIKKDFMDKYIDKKDTSYATSLTRVYNDTYDITKLDYWVARSLYYRSLEECQAVCDYLNNKEEV
jgi:hypothetical protein